MEKSIATALKGKSKSEQAYIVGEEIAKRATKKGFLIACGKNTVIEILEVQPSGKRIMKANEFANGSLRKYLK